jgi:hypothetical protein
MTRLSLGRGTGRRRILMFRMIGATHLSVYPRIVRSLVLSAHNPMI